MNKMYLAVAACTLIYLLQGCASSRSQLLCVTDQNHIELMSLREMDLADAENSIVALLTKLENENAYIEMSVVFEDPARDEWKMLIRSRETTTKTKRFYSCTLCHDSDVVVRLGCPIKGMYDTNCEACPIY